jgi:hypothetical protein
MKEEEVEEEMGEGIGEERVSSPPPPRCPTTWVVHPSTPEEKECFREQVCHKFSMSSACLGVQQQTQLILKYLSSSVIAVTGYRLDSQSSVPS